MERLESLFTNPHKYKYNNQLFIVYHARVLGSE